MNPSILITGLAGAGKSTVAHILHSRFRQKTVNVGDLLLRRLEEVGIPLESRVDIGPKFVNHFGEYEIFHIVAEAIENHNADVFDGVRLADTCKRIRAHYPQALIWVITADTVRRIQRLRKEMEQLGVSANIDAFLKRSAIYDCEEAQIEKMADTIIQNNGAVEHLNDIVAREFTKIHDSGSS